MYSNLQLPLSIFTYSHDMCHNAKMKSIFDTYKRNLYLSELIQSFSPVLSRHGAISSWSTNIPFVYPVNTYAM